MAYIRPCNRCGQRISMREMRAGQWVAFDASTENPHKCGKKNKANPDIKKLAKENNKIRNNVGIDLGYDVNDVSVIKLINKSIKENKRLNILYESYYGKTSTREISPIKKFKFEGEDHLQSYCHFKKDERSFRIDSILEAQITNKKLFKSKRISKPNLKDYINKIKSEQNKEADQDFKIENKNIISKEKTSKLTNYQKKNLKAFQNEIDEKKGSLNKLLIVLGIWFVIAVVLSHTFG